MCSSDLISKVLAYALMRRSEDATNARAGEMADRAIGLASRAEAAGSFLGPGIASLSEDGLCPAPDIGQDSVAILTEAGLARDTIDELIKAGAVRQARQ